MKEAERLRDYMLREKEEPEKTKEAVIEYLKTFPLTNKERLSTLTDEEAWAEIFDAMSREQMTEWMGKYGGNEKTGGSDTAESVNTER